MSAGLSLAEQLYAGSLAESKIEMELDDLGVPLENIGWDDYDNSIEIYGVSDDYRASPEVLAFLKQAGFSVAYVNHKDGWETHYGLSDGHEWRVNYGRGPRVKLS